MFKMRINMRIQKIIIALAIGLTVYAAMILATKTVTITEIRTIRQRIR